MKELFPLLPLQALSADWGKSGRLVSIIGAGLIAWVGYILFGILNRTIGLGVSVSLVSMCIVLGGFFIGWLYFGEKITMRHMLGACAAIVAILLLN